MSERGEVERESGGGRDTEREREREREVTTTLSAAILPYMDNTTHAQTYDDASFPKSQTVFNTTLHIYTCKSLLFPGSKQNRGSESTIKIDRPISLQYL